MPFTHINTHTSWRRAEEKPKIYAFLLSLLYTHFYYISLLYMQEQRRSRAINCEQNVSIPYEKAIDFGYTSSKKTKQRWCFKFIHSLWLCRRRHHFFADIHTTNIISSAHTHLVCWLLILCAPTKMWIYGFLYDKIV